MPWTRGLSTSTCTTPCGPPTTGATWSSRSTRSPPTVRRRTDAARAQPGRPALPAAGGRGQAVRPAELPGVDRPQRVRPRCDAHRDVRAHGRPARLPAEPGAGEELPGLPGPAGHPADPAQLGPGRRHVLAVGATAGD